LARHGRVREAVSHTALTAGSMIAGSMVSGDSPISPSSTALSVPWPTPVALREPNSSIVTRHRLARPAWPSSARVKRSAARIGPTVCELEGPIPTLNKSKTLMLMLLSRRDAT